MIFWQFKEVGAVRAAYFAEETQEQQQFVEQEGTFSRFAIDYRILLPALHNYVTMQVLTMQTNFNFCRVVFLQHNLWKLTCHLLLQNLIWFCLQIKERIKFQYVAIEKRNYAIYYCKPVIIQLSKRPEIRAERFLGIVEYLFCNLTK